MGVEYVIESTGLFVEAEKAAGHIEAGAKKVPQVLKLGGWAPRTWFQWLVYHPPVYKPNGY